MGEHYQQYRLERIVEVVSRRMTINRQSIFSRSRPATVALARQTCMALARSLTNLSQNEVGEYFGGRDHGTVIHAEQSITARRETDKRFRALFDGIQAELTGEFTQALNRDVALCELPATDRQFCQYVINLLGDPKHNVLADGLRRRVFSIGYGKAGEPMIVGMSVKEL